VSWQRTIAIPALVKALQAVAGEAVYVHSRPPNTLNPPCLVVLRPTEVRYDEVAFGIDQADISVLCVAPADGEDTADELITAVRSAVGENINLGGAVQVVDDQAERNWRNVNVAGVDLLTVEVALQIQM